jgi:hypothetical protein
MNKLDQTVIRNTLQDVLIKTRNNMQKVCVIIVIMLMVGLNWHLSALIKIDLYMLNLCVFHAIKREKGLLENKN